MENTDTTVLPAACPMFFIFFMGKEMKKIKNIGQAARRWQVVVRVRWSRFQGRVSGLYYQRVSLPVQWWRGCGCPAQWRPRLPWWHSLVYRWLRLSGWVRR